MSRLAQLGAALLLGLCPVGLRAEPAQPILTITAGPVTTHFTAAQLLSHTDLASVEIPPHVDYSVSLTVQAVPLLSLLAALPLEGFDRLEASATDGFVAQIPLALIEAGKSGGSVAWIAVEDANRRWPKLPGKDTSAGSFYLVWQYPERSHVSNEQWPYMLEKLTADRVRVDAVVAFLHGLSNKVHRHVLERNASEPRRCQLQPPHDVTPGRRENG